MIEPADRLLRCRWRAFAAGRRLRLARFWQAHGDLDQAARHGERAFRMLDRCGCATTMPGPIGAVALLLAEIDRDRAAYPASLSRLRWLVRLLDGAVERTDSDRTFGGTRATADGDRLLDRALIALVDVYRRSGRYDQVGPVTERAMRLIDNGDPANAQALAALLTVRGMTAKELGEFDLAAGSYDRVGEIHRKYGAAPANAAALAHNLAGLAYAQDLFAVAESHARTAVALRRRVPGRSRVPLAEDLAVLAAAIAGQDRFDEARALFDEAMAICRAARPPRRYEIAVHLHNLAVLHQRAGDLAGSERLYHQALALREQLLGADHPEIALLANNLGTLLRDQQRIPEAAAQFRRALDIAERCLPPDHPMTITARENSNQLVQG